jgi:hypothetical protein
LLELLVYIFFLVLMPLLLLWAGRFAKYSAQHKASRIGVPEAKPMEPAIETGGGVNSPTSVSPHEAKG